MFTDSVKIGPRLANKRKSRGFTLIELLVVIAIIGLLSSVVMASLNSARVKARDTRRISDFRQIQTAMELFYNQTGRYPRSPGHATWSGHWALFSQCLETGVNCGFTVSNYIPVISKVPQDPSRTISDPFANDRTYYPSSGYSCTDQMYRINACLETNHSILQSDLDGPFFNATACNDGLSTQCTGLYGGYCVGTEVYSDTYVGC